MFKSAVRWISSSSATLKGPRNYVNRKTGRGCGNAVLPRFEWRYDKAMGKNFQKSMGIKYGINMGLEDRLLLVSLGSKQRRLDDKKVIQLSRIMEERIGEVMATDEVLADLQIQITKVRVDKSFNQVSVSWLCRGDGSDLNVAETLETARHQIRRRVGELVGVSCPEFKFIGDKSLLMEQEMDRLFREADYGIDYRLLSKSARILGNVDEPEKKRNRPKWLKPQVSTDERKEGT